VKTRDEEDEFYAKEENYEARLKSFLRVLSSWSGTIKKKHLNGTGLCRVSERRSVRLLHFCLKYHSRQALASKTLYLKSS
jgi:hypothetical protein